MRMQTDNTPPHDTEIRDNVKKEKNLLVDEKAVTHFSEDMRRNALS